MSKQGSDPGGAGERNPPESAATRERAEARRPAAAPGSAETREPVEAPDLRLLRWTMATGSSGMARAAVVLGAGDHQWNATAESSGAIHALFDAVDAALEGVLGGVARLVAFDVHAIGETAGADALVELVIEPPASATGERASGRYSGSARDENLVAACAEAYLAALRRMLGDDAWSGATEAAGNARLADLRARAERAAARAQLDEAQTEDPGSWFER